VSNPPRLRDFPGFYGPGFWLFAPADRASEASCAGAERERGCAVPSRWSKRPLGAALNSYRKFSGAGSALQTWQTCVSSVGRCAAQSSAN
jgi:hypothetical protein